MRYRLGDICTITKGTTGIMKSVPGEYTMVALGEANKTHNEFQFDAKAVIIPLVSSTGHGHASMKRVKYQEGKFALGNILCAVIPKDESFVLAKYLQIYLHWNREELLVSQMKGMANVSLPMNRIADVEVIVPSMEEQRHIVELEAKLVEKENEAGVLFADQLTQIACLNQAILQEAVQGKLVPQDPNDEPASELLKRIKAEKEKSGKKQKPLPPIKPEELKIGGSQIPFEIPESWIWCRLEDVCERIHYGFNASAKPQNTGVRLLRITDIQNNSVDWETVPGCDYSESDLDNYLLYENDIVIARTGGTIGKTFLVKNIPLQSLFASYLIRAIPSKLVMSEYIKYYMESPIYWKQLYDAAGGAAQPNVNGTSLSNLAFPLPPFTEQKSIITEIEKQFAKTRQLKEYIISNQQATEQLLKALLHEAFVVEETKVESEKTEAKIIEFKPKKCSSAEKAILAGHIINLTNNENFGRVKFQKLLFLAEYHCNLNLESNYVQKAAGPHDADLIEEVESTLKRFRFYDIQQSNIGNHKVNYTALSAAAELDSLFVQNFESEYVVIDGLLAKFKNSTWEQCEIVATLYAVWNNRIIRKELITDELLKQDFLNWDKQKIKYKDRLDGALDWMRRKEIVPDGRGNYIDKPQNSKKTIR